MSRSPVASGWRSAAWLVVDAGLAALFAGPTEALLLFLVSPDRPLTLRDFFATLVALLPQILVVFVLLGPAAVLTAIALSVGRTTARGPSARHVLRFALLDAVLLAVAALVQWRTLGPQIPDPGRTALGLTTSTLIVTAVVLAVLAVRDARSPTRPLVPWLAAVAVGLAVALSIAGELRRTRFTTPRAVELPGFVASRSVLLLEVPGLDREVLDRAIVRGEVPALAALASRGFVAPVDAAPADDTLAAHASLITGRGPEHHGVLDSRRYRPRGDRRSFAVLPRGLFLRTLVRTPAWTTIPVDHRSMRCVGLPEIVQALGVGRVDIVEAADSGTPAAGTRPQRGMAMISDPLGWAPAAAGQWFVPREALGPGRRVSPASSPRELSCPDPGDVSNRFFDPPAAGLSETARFAARVRRALSADRCALMLGERALDDGYRIVHVRLDGHGEIAPWFSGFRGDDPARGVSNREMDAYGKALQRYLRELDPHIGGLLSKAEPERLVVVVSPHGVSTRQDLGRLLGQVIGLDEPTGALDGSPPGVVVLGGSGVRKGSADERPIRLTSILPTVLWILDLPVAADMGGVAREPFEERFISTHPAVTVPSYTREIRGSRRGAGEETGLPASAR
ncbi:MAG: alkaline phosphatase family protein [Acidobacteriota bacterium]|nr:alkaline phosphatase family protein [Acidobacteriota bacterium]